MDNPEKMELERMFQELLDRPHSAQWIEEMIAHYRRTGHFIPADLKRLLGDPSKAAQIDPNLTVEAILAASFSGSGR